MGNHDAGRAMQRAAEMALKMRTTQPALELLDSICQPWRGCDAEFESCHPTNPHLVHPDFATSTDPDGPIGRLIAEAFGEAGRDYLKGWPEDEDAVDAWWEGPYGKFRERYEFC